MRALTFFVILLSTWFGMPSFIKGYMDVQGKEAYYPKQHDATSESILPKASMNIPKEATMATRYVEDERSIVLRYHSTGNGRGRGNPLKWISEYENPLSLRQKSFVYVIKKAVRKALLDVPIEIDNLDVVLWNNENFVGADVAFNFRIRSWRDNDYWQHAIANTFNASEKRWYVEKSSSTHPVYLSFVREPLYIMGDEDAPYLTSSELTYEFVYNDNEWSEHLLRPDSREYQKKCHAINEDINQVYVQLGVIGMRYHKCVFWQIGKEVRSAVTILIPFDRNGTFGALDNQKGFRKQFAKQYEKIREQLDLCQELKKVITIHTTPALFPKPAITSTTVISTPESTFTTNPPELETTTSDPCLPSKSEFCSEGLD